MQDCVAKGRTGNQKKSCCKWGHPFDDANTRWSDGTRVCRACERERGRSPAKREAARKRYAARKSDPRAQQ